MTDKDDLTVLLDKLGIPYEVNEDNKDDNVIEVTVINNSDHDKVTGYCGFYTSFEFDREGNFQAVGAWE